MRNAKRDVGIRKILVERLGGECFFCESKKNLEIDHIRPIFIGGKDSVMNIQVLCQKCYRKKTKFDSFLYKGIGIKKDFKSCVCHFFYRQWSKDV